MAVKMTLIPFIAKIHTLKYHHHLFTRPPFAIVRRFIGLKYKYIEQTAHMKITEIGRHVRN